jgi:hypothetical protein
VSDLAVAIAFFDPAGQIHGTARSGATVLFEGTSPTAHPEGPAVEERDGSLHAELEGRLSLDLRPLSEEADLGGMGVRTCRVTGEALGRPIDCLGTLSETRRAPSWDELDALRTISVLVDDETGLLLMARRPRGARGHGDELVTAWLVHAGELVSVEDARVSTVYDAHGRQRSAGLELWLPGEDFPRRGSGNVVAGSSLQLEGLDVHVAVFRWQLEENEGFGGYEVMARSPDPPAA